MSNTFDLNRPLYVYLSCFPKQRMRHADLVSAVFFLGKVSKRREEQVDQSKMSRERDRFFINLLKIPVPPVMHIPACAATGDAPP